MPYTTGSLTTNTPGTELTGAIGSALVGVGWVHVEDYLNGANEYRVYRCPAAVSGAPSDYFLVLLAQAPSAAGVRSQQVWAALCEGYNTTSHAMTKYVPVRPAGYGPYWNFSMYPPQPDGSHGGAAYPLPNTTPYGAASHQINQTNGSGPGVTNSIAWAGFVPLGLAAVGSVWVMSLTPQRLIVGLRDLGGVEVGVHLGLLSSYLTPAADPMPLFQGRLQFMDPFHNFMEYRHSGFTREPGLASSVTVSSGSNGSWDPFYNDYPFVGVVLPAGANLNEPGASGSVMNSGGATYNDWYQQQRPLATRLEAQSLVQSWMRGIYRVQSPAVSRTITYSSRRGALRDVVGFPTGSVTGLALGDTFTYPVDGTTRTFAKIGTSAEAIFVDTGV